MTAIQQITAVAASLGWEVKTDIQQKKRVEFEFQRYTKMGQDFFFTVGMKGNDTGSLISEIEDYYEDFDPDYEAYLWIGTEATAETVRLTISRTLSAIWRMPKL